VVLGVSFVVGALVLTDTLGQTFNDLFTTINKNTAVSVRGVKPLELDDQDGQSGVDRKPVPAATLDAVRRVDGVSQAVADINGEAVLVGSDGKPIVPAGPPALGFNWVDSPTLNLQHVSQGRAPLAADEVTLNADLVATSGKHVGDSATVLTKTGQHQVRIVGETRYGASDLGSLGGSTAVTFTTAAAQQVFGLPPGTYSDIAVAAKDGLAQDALRSRIMAILPAGAEAVTGTQVAAEQSSGTSSFVSFLNTFLLVFAGVALFVGAFIILNTFTILVAQRTKELALMRALGGSRGQVTRSVLLESTVVGTIASALGLGAGIGVALGLKALFTAFGAGLPDGPTVVSARTVLVAFAVGILITVLASLIPARKAGRMAPVAAMQDAATPDRSLVGQTVAGAFALAAGAAALSVGLIQGILWLVGVGAAVGFVGIAVLSPWLSRPVASALGGVFRRGVAGRLGRQNALRNPRRTAATAAALMIGLALVSAVAVLGASLKGSMTAIVDGTVGADFVLDTNATGITEQQLAVLRAQPGVGALNAMRFSQVRLGDGAIEVQAADPVSIGTTESLTRVDGDLTGLGPGRMLVSDKVAAQRGWHVGSVVPVTYPDDVKDTARITGTYQDNPLSRGTIMDTSVAAHFSSQLYQAALLRVAPGADRAQVGRELTAAAAPFPNILVQDRSEFTKAQTDQVDQLVQFLTLLLVLSVLIAFLGIVNTLALSVLERTRELGLLRAVGMARRQVKRMVRVESVIIAVFGGLLGVAVGIGLGVALRAALAGKGVTVLSLPSAQLGLYLLFAGVVGVIAAWFPARRAARLNVLAAISSG
jgi:putative ABC transport system permease protein